LDNFAAAIVHLETAAKLNPSQGAVYYQLARAYTAAGRKADARRAFQKVAELKQQGVEFDQRVFANPPASAARED
jgi:Flp pilus assembly protein TadD